MPTATPSTNGHHPELERLIEDVQSEAKPEPEAEVKPKRTRRTKAEMAANNVKPHQPALITILLDGHDVTGTPASLAALLAAMPARVA